MTTGAHTCSVLVVDDDEEHLELLRLALAKEGYKVAWARNGREALDHLRSTAEVCIIVLDLLMPVMGGAEFRAAQRRDRSLAWMPVVVVSGAMDAADAARALGARAFVKKPVDLDRLTETLTAIGCERRQGDRPLH